MYICVVADYVGLPSSIQSNNSPVRSICSVAAICARCRQTGEHLLCLTVIPVEHFRKTIAEASKITIIWVITMSLVFIKHFDINS